MEKQSHGAIVSNLRQFQSLAHNLESNNLRPVKFQTLFLLINDAQPVDNRRLN